MLVPLLRIRTYHVDADPDTAFTLMRIRILSSKLRLETLKQAYISYILACHLQNDVDPDPASL